MRTIKIRFERDASLDHVEVLVRAPEESEEVAALLDKLADQTSDSIRVFDGYGIVRQIQQEEIVSASMDNKLVNIVTVDGTWYTRQTLQSLEAVLDPHRFLRISRYELINLDKVHRYDFSVAGTLRLELEGGTETWASRRCIPAIRKRLMGKE